jgi:LDH2 family malate/lactate/ureidoglycolate dehydrogenase
MHYRYDDLIHYAQSLLTAAGLEPAKAAAVAEILVEGDLMGHNTHGLALLPGYLGEIESGAMEKLGAPTVLADAPSRPDLGRPPPARPVAGAAGDGSWPPSAPPRQGTGTVVIRRSHHIASLASLPQARHRPGPADAADLLRPERRQRRALRRAGRGVHAQPGVGGHSHRRACRC